MGVEADIHGALMARVETLALSPALPVAWPGVPFTQTGGDYLRVSHQRATPIRNMIAGADPLDRFGFVALDLFTVMAVGRHQIETDALAGSIIAHFPRDLRLTRGGVSVRIVSSWARAARPDPNGTHWHTPIVVDYRALA